MKYTYSMASHYFVSRKGQSFIEYSILAIIIISGIIIGGPVLLNSIKAHFRIMDTAAQDSMTERIRQDPNYLDFLPPGASVGPGSSNPCTDWDTSSGQCGEAPCSGFKKPAYRTCSFGQEIQCIKPDNCCTAAVASSCGTLINSSDASNECISRRTIETKVHAILGTQPGFSGTCLDTENKDLGHCAVGERLFTVACIINQGDGSTALTSAADSGIAISSSPTNGEGTTPESTGDTTTDPTAPTVETYNVCRSLPEDAISCSPTCATIPDSQARRSQTCGNYGPTEMYREVMKRRASPGTPPRTVLPKVTTAPDTSAFTLSNIYFNTASDCSDRPCERYCKNTDPVTGDELAASANGASCLPLLCKNAEPLTQLLTSKTSATDPAKPAYVSKKLNYATDFSIDVFSKNLRYIAACFNDVDEIIYQTGSSVLTSSFSCPSSQETTIGTKTYCLENGTTSPDTDPAITHAMINCTKDQGTRRALIKVWEDSATSSELGYTATYTKCETYQPSPQSACSPDVPLRLQSGTCPTGTRVITDHETYAQFCQQADPYEGGNVPWAAWAASAPPNSSDDLGCIIPAQGNLCPDGSHTQTGGYCCMVFCKETN